MVRLFIYLAVFGFGVVIGAGFPSYSVQYQQRLHAQFDQVTLDLKPFQEIADRYHGGSLKALIQHHLNSEDPTFHDEGLAIQLMFQNQERLAEASTSLGAPLLNQAVYLYSNIDYGLAKTTWDAYTPTVVTTAEALTFAVSTGLVMVIVCYLLWSVSRLAIRRYVIGRCL